MFWTCFFDDEIPKASRDASSACYCGIYMWYRLLYCFPYDGGITAEIRHACRSPWYFEPSQTVTTLGKPHVRRGLNFSCSDGSLLLCNFRDICRNSVRVGLKFKRYMMMMGVVVVAAAVIPKQQRTALHEKTTRLLKSLAQQVEVLRPSD